MVKDTQNNLYFFIISFSKKPHGFHARWHLNGFLSHEMVSSLL